MAVGERQGDKSAVFFGEYQHRVDLQGRVAIPARFRGAFHEGAVLARGYDRCVLVYPPEEWQQFTERLNSLPTTLAKNRRFLRLTFGTAFPVDLDRQGRILLPGPLRSYAGIGEEVVVAGVGRSLEIWNLERWQEEQRQMEAEGWYLAESMEERS